MRCKLVWPGAGVVQELGKACFGVQICMTWNISSVGMGRACFGMQVGVAW